MFINIQNISSIQKMLSGLSEDSIANFGQMNAQQMVEHLSLVLQISQGKQKAMLSISEEHLPKFRAFLYSSNPIEPGFKSKAVTAETLTLKHPDIEMAKESLVLELKSFFKYYMANPRAEHMNPTFGMLNFGEWIIFHNKHFTHHFRQFKLC